jgi:putative DNA primase/helicase
MSDKLQEWREFRDAVANYCHGQWHDVLHLFGNLGVSDKFFDGKKKETCPACKRKEKLYIVDQRTFAAHCAAESCQAHYYDGITLLTELSNKKQSDVVSILADHFNFHKKKLGGKKFEKYGHKRKRVHNQRSGQQTLQPVAPIVEILSPESQYIDRVKRPISNTPAHLYLTSRGIDVTQIDTSELFYVESMRHYVDNDNSSKEPSFTEHPALVGRVKSPAGTTVGFNIIFLNEDGTKANVETQKRLSSRGFEGAYTGSYVDLAVPFKGVLGIAEGMETSMAINQCGIPCRSVVTANGIRNFKIPEGLNTLYLFGDLDASATGEKVIIEKYYELQQTHPNLKVKLYLPPEELITESDRKSIDFLDVLARSPQIMAKMSKRCMNIQ